MVQKANYWLGGFDVEASYKVYQESAKQLLQIVF